MLSFQKKQKKNAQFSVLFNVMTISSINHSDAISLASI